MSANGQKIISFIKAGKRWNMAGRALATIGFVVWIALPARGESFVWKINDKDPPVSGELKVGACVPLKFTLSGKYACVGHVTITWTIYRDGQPIDSSSQSCIGVFPSGTSLTPKDFIFEHPVTGRYEVSEKRPLQKEYRLPGVLITSVPPLPTCPIGSLNSSQTLCSLGLAPNDGYILKEGFYRNPVSIACKLGTAEPLGSANFGHCLLTTLAGGLILKGDWYYTSLGARKVDECETFTEALTAVITQPVNLSQFPNKPQWFCRTISSKLKPSVNAGKLLIPAPVKCPDSMQATKWNGVGCLWLQAPAGSQPHKSGGEWLYSPQRCP
jgi:hypothetical protein